MGSSIFLKGQSCTTNARLLKVFGSWSLFAVYFRFITEQILLLAEAVVYRLVTVSLDDSYKTALTGSEWAKASLVCRKQSTGTSTRLMTRVISHFKTSPIDFPILSTATPQSGALTYRRRYAHAKSQEMSGVKQEEERLMQEDTGSGICVICKSYNDEIIIVIITKY